MKNLESRINRLYEKLNIHDRQNELDYRKLSWADFLKTSEFMKGNIERKQLNDGQQSIVVFANYNVDNFNLLFKRWIKSFQ